MSGEGSLTDTQYLLGAFCLPKSSITLPLQFLRDIILHPYQINWLVLDLNKLRQRVSPLLQITRPSTDQKNPRARPRDGYVTHVSQALLINSNRKTAFAITQAIEILHSDLLFTCFPSKAIFYQRSPALPSTSKMRRPVLPSSPRM